MKVVVFGSGGLTGRFIVQFLHETRTITELITPVRMLRLPAGAGIKEVLFNFSDPGSYASLFPADGVFCALGTTIKKAGSQEKFREVDFEYPLMAAKAASAAKVPHFLLVSALGANPDSRVFYNRVKGELEREIKKLPFRSITFVRPSLLLGIRQEFRLGEMLMKPLTPFIPLRYKPVQASRVAGLLVQAFFNQEPGVHIFENAAIHRQRR